MVAFHLPADFRDRHREFLGPGRGRADVAGCLVGRVGHGAQALAGFIHGFVHCHGGAFHRVRRVANGRGNGADAVLEPCGQPGLGREDLANRHRSDIGAVPIQNGRCGAFQGLRPNREPLAQRQAGGVGEDRALRLGVGVENAQGLSRDAIRRHRQMVRDPGQHPLRFGIDIDDGTVAPGGRGDDGDGDLLDHLALDEGLPHHASQRFDRYGHLPDFVATAPIGHFGAGVAFGDAA